MFRTFYLFNNLYSKKNVSFIQRLVAYYQLCYHHYSHHDNQTLKDWMLALLVAVFISINIFILVVYTVVEAVHVDA